MHIYFTEEPSPSLLVILGLLVPIKLKLYQDSTTYAAIRVSYITKAVDWT